MRLDGKVTLITGAGGGIGREAALLFAREGSRIAVGEIDEIGGNQTVELIRQAGGEALFIQVDVSQAVEVEAMVRRAEEAFGQLDVIYNNAGINLAGDMGVAETEEEIWDKVIAVNLKGVYLGAKYGIPALLRAGGGSMINVASFVALMGAAVPQIAYTASKGAVLALTREVAVEYGRRNIRVNALCPGPIQTPLMAGLLADETARQRRLVHIPIGRFGTALEVAQAALFLASDDSSLMTGAALVVDGGITAAYITPE